LAKTGEMVFEDIVWSAALHRVFNSIDDILDDEFVAFKMRLAAPGFGSRILLRLICERDAMIQLGTAREFVALFESKFPR
jgi:hypothetical protein